MADLVFVVLTIAFFALTALIVRGVERLWPRRTSLVWSCPSCSSATSRWPCSSRSVS